MMLRAAIALLALAMPASAQHGGAHGGSSGSRGFAGRAGFSAPSGFSRPAGPMLTVRYGAPAFSNGFPPFRQTGPPNRAGLRIPYNGNAFQAARPSRYPIAAPPSSARYRAFNPAQYRASTRRNNSNGDLFAARRRSFRNWYVSNYPTWPGYGYPYLIDPGFYDSGFYNWDDSVDSDSGDSAYAPAAVAPYDEAPYPDQGYSASGESGELPPWIPPVPQRAAAEPSAPSAYNQALTVIFKSGRDPVKMQNYMLTAKALTDLDSRHYEQIPIDQIDVIATRWANTSAGLRFEIPTASRN